MKIGFIGGGNMGGAIIGGIIKSGIAQAENIIVSDLNMENLTRLKEEYSVNITNDNTKSADSEILFLCVKPNVLIDVIDGISSSVDSNTTVVSIAAGRSITDIEKAFDKPVKLIRVMPNTPALVGAGMAALALNQVISDDKYTGDVNTVLDIFNSFGIGEIVPEKLMDAVTAVSGSAPAYVFMMIEAMADAAVMGGMPRNQAYTFAAQAVYGSAKMVLDTGKHPGELKDMVCSPAGTTIDAVSVLEEEGFRFAMIKAMKACMDKSAKL